MKPAPVRKVVDHKENSTGSVRLQLACGHFLTSSAAELPERVHCQQCRRSQASAWFDFLTAKRRPA